MSDERGNESAPEDKVIVSLYLEAERRQLQGEPSYDAPAGLARFRAWLDANSDDTGSAPANPVRHLQSPPARSGVPDLNWLITNFVERVPDVVHAVVVSSDGMPLAFSAGLPPERADQLAAVASGLVSLSQGASRVFEGGTLIRTVVDTQRGVMFVMAISNGSSLIVLASTTCDAGLVSYEMTLLVERASRVLTPTARADTHASHPFGA
jgi:predicted regulator of Ras-like GTPase activity (Roadblock/LC7/MglB family)